ncbi:MAG: hypothetical protein F4087_01590 [Gemmatimonadetes bacterium]|nr:hypothetical protein [Gemmatimonadota bacterium]
MITKPWNVRYPVHVRWTEVSDSILGAGDLPDLRTAVQRAVARWAAVLWPTPVAEHDGEVTCGDSRVMDSLRPGVTILVDITLDETRGASAHGCTFADGRRYNPKTGTIAGGRILLGLHKLQREEEYHAKYPGWMLEHLTWIVAHEIGHILGVSGVNQRWADGRELVGGRYFQTDSAVVAVMRRLLPTSHPALDGRKLVPLHDRHHWGRCVDVGDLMGATHDGGRVAVDTNGRPVVNWRLTELTLSALQGFRYDPRFADPPRRPPVAGC